MRSGELARNAGVNLQTLRFYEREGLLPNPARTAAGYRSYQRRDLERVLFIKRNQQIGFTLAEIKQLIELHRALSSLGPKHFRRRPRELQGIIEIGRARLEAIKQKAHMLDAMQQQLERLLGKLQSMEVVNCPVGRATPKSSRFKKSS